MRTTLLLAAACLGLVACAPGGKAAIVKACVDDGSPQKTCDCMASELEKKLDKDVFRAMVLEAQGKQAEAQAALEKLPLDKKFSMATSVVAVAMTCGLS